MCKKKRTEQSAVFCPLFQWTGTVLCPVSFFFLFFFSHPWITMLGNMHKKTKRKQDRAQCPALFFIGQALRSVLSFFSFLVHLAQGPHRFPVWAHFCEHRTKRGSAWFIGIGKSTRPARLCCLVRISVRLKDAIFKLPLLHAFMLFRCGGTGDWDSRGRTLL